MRPINGARAERLSRTVFAFVASPHTATLAPSSLSENNEQCSNKSRSLRKGENAMDLGLQDKHAIVTGGSRGIGKAIARELAREGADVAIVARNKGDLEATARELAAETNRRIIPLAADVTSKEQVRGLRIAKQLGIPLLRTPGLCAAKRHGTARFPRCSGLWIPEPAALFSLLRFQYGKSRRWLSRRSPFEGLVAWGRVRDRAC